MDETPVPITIPDNLEACQALVEQLAQTVQEQSGKIEELNQQKQELELTVQDLMQRAFRRRSERYIADPDQLKLDFGDSEDAADAAEGLAQAVEEAGVAVKEHKRRPRQRKSRNEKL